MEDHYRGIKGHSTLSAKSLIDWHAAKSLNNDTICLILRADLSVAFDTIDHRILLSKLSYYRFEDKEFNLMKSYLKKECYSLN